MGKIAFIDVYEKSVWHGWRNGSRRAQIYWLTAWACSYFINRIKLLTTQWLSEHTNIESQTKVQTTWFFLHYFACKTYSVDVLHVKDSTSWSRRESGVLQFLKHIAYMYMLQPLPCFCNIPPTIQQTRHRASTSTRWHFAFALCCHSNATRAPIVNLPNRAQLGGTPYHFPKLHLGPCSNVSMRPRTGTHSRRAWPLHFASSMTHAKCNHRAYWRCSCLRRKLCAALQRLSN